ncbi:MAG: type II toxin-antitoxin system HipA family toxin [Rhodopseudomonas sp.]|nr:type II toxin-antitoxin system HipA family toxin [Rhodopseudomonas sp.]
MTDPSLDVWLSDRRVGRLYQVGGRLVFVYAADWLVLDDIVALSVSMPLQVEPYNDRAARAFFAGLLPEHEQRHQVARALGVSPRNDFALLAGVGGECAGAVTFTPPGDAPVLRPIATDYWPLEDIQLAGILKTLPERPLLAGEADLRLCLAGVHDKLPVLLKAGRILLPLNGVPSSHIVKPARRDIAGSVYNEAFCLALARAIGLSTAASAVGTADNEDYVLIERYDRETPTKGGPVRLHQEDFCQALAVPPERKYEEDGGPSLADCFGLLRSVVARPVLDLPRLLDVVLFNALVGNNDAHGKSFSLVYTAGGLRLAPLYGTMCTAIYPGERAGMAMKIGGTEDFAALAPRHWQRLARDAGLSAPQTRRRLIDMATRLPAAALTLRGDFEAYPNGLPVIDRIVALLTERCASTLGGFDVS